MDIASDNNLFAERSSTEPNWLIRFFHNIPHVDFSFQRVNATFNLDSSKYKESILAWSSLPVFVLLLILNLLVAYFVCLCVCKKKRGDERSNQLDQLVQDDSHNPRCLTALQWTLACLSIFACVLSGLGLRGEEETHKSIFKMTDSLDYMWYTLYATRNQLYIVEKSLNITSRGIVRIKKVFRSHSELSYNLSNLLHTGAERSFQHNFEAMRNLREIMEVGGSNRILVEETIAQIVVTTKKYEVIRRVIVVMFFVLCILLSLLLLVGVARSSRCLLLIFSSLDIIAIVFSWISVNIHSGVAMGIADFCQQPDTFMSNMLTPYVEEYMAEYYLKCQPLLRTNPFTQEFERAQHNIMESRSYIYRALDLAKQFINPNELSVHVRSVYQGLNETYTCLSKLIALTDCTNLNKDYKDIIFGICFVGLPGLSFVILSCLLLGIIFPILIVLTVKLRRIFEIIVCNGRRLQSVSKSGRMVDESSIQMEFPSSHSRSNICMHYSGMSTLPDLGETMRESVA